MSAMTKKPLQEDQLSIFNAAQVGVESDSVLDTRCLDDNIYQDQDAVHGFGLSGWEMAALQELRNCGMFIPENVAGANPNMKVAINNLVAKYLAKIIEGKLFATNSGKALFSRMVEWRAPPPAPKQKTPARTPKKKEEANVPDTITTLIEQMGGMRLNGALAYIGGEDVVWKDNGKDSYSSRVTPEGFIDYSIGIQFKINLKNWKMVVALEIGDDEYTVYLWKPSTTKEMLESGKAGEVIDSRDRVQWEELQSTIEEIYDRAIKKYQGGFIEI